MEDNDRERVLCNIAALLARELAHLQLLPAVREYMESPHSLSSIVCKMGTFRKEPFEKGALVLCQTSTGVQQHPFLISLVEKQGIENDARGLVLRAIGRNDLCNYGNESFVEIIGIPERMMWTGEKRKFALKIEKVMRKISVYAHRYRGLVFVGDWEADVYVGEAFGGLETPTKPYAIRVAFNKKTTLKKIREDLLAGGYGTREFDPDDGVHGPFHNPRPITRDDVLGALKAQGTKLKV